MRQILIILYSVLLISFTANAQESSDLSVKRIFGSDDFATDRLPVSKWVDGGEFYTTVDENDTVEYGFDIVKNNTLTGAREILVEASKLIPEGGEMPLSIADYKWSDDGKYLLISTNTRKFRRRNSFGDYWILNLEDNELRQIGIDAPSQSLMYAKFSPDSKKIAYMYENNIYAETISNGRVRQLTKDGDEFIVNGTGDWVYEEELGLRDAFMWSPDSERIAYWQSDTRGVGTFYMIDNRAETGVYSKPVPLQYPKAGTTNSAVRVGTVKATGGRTKWVDVPGDPRQHYIARMQWANSSEELMIQQLNRLQNVNHVMMGNVKNGRITTILKESDDAWVDMRRDGLRWVKDGDYFTWLSERDGWRHLYLISRDGSEVTLLTEGDFDVINIVNIDENGGWVYFLASPDNATQQYLYRTSLFGERKLERLTPENQRGIHSYNVGPDSKYAFHTYSKFGTPPVIDLVSLPDHKSEKIMVANESLHDAVGAVERGKQEIFSIDIENGYNLDGFIMYPHDFDPAKKYPLFVYVYGHPGGRTVSDNWGGNNYLWHTMLTQKGYIVASFNNHGGSSPRGRAWRKDVYQNVGQLPPEEHAQGVQALIKKHSFIDKDRVGVWGWSGGGSSTLDAMSKHADTYHVGMAVAAVTDLHLYDTIYQERYTGLPEGGEDAYYKGSAINYIHQMKGDLLIIHGTGDDNVHYQNQDQLIDKLIEHNKQFQMMSYPMRAHGIRAGKNTREHLFTHMTDYLMEHLPSGDR